MSQPIMEHVEGRTMYSITTTTTVVKIPGPTDTVVVTATNPSGNPVPGQSETLTLSNRAAKRYA